MSQVELTSSSSASSKLLTICERYGIELKEEDIVEVRAIADHEGEVGWMRFGRLLWRKLLLQIRKNDFIKHIKQSNLMTEFKQTDPGSDLHWRKIICLAFRSREHSSFQRVFLLRLQIVVVSTLLEQQLRLKTLLCFQMLYRMPRLVKLGQGRIDLLPRPRSHHASQNE